MKSVVLIGGGASGVVAGRELAGHRGDGTFLEAKERLGGRILTRRTPGSIAELGAEFVHGRSQQMLKVVRAAGLKLIDASEQNRLAKAGKLKKVDLWERVGEVIGKIDPHQRDLPFGHWLERAKFDAETKELALAFVEGFNASDARVIGAHSLLRAEYASEKEEGEKQARPREGYGALIDALRAAAERDGAKIKLGERVRQIRWRRGAVTVKTEASNIFEGDAAVVTLPLGVLKAGTVSFEPSLV